MQRNVDLIDLVKSFLTNIPILTSIYYLIANIGFDTAENEPFNFHNFSSLRGFNFHRAVVSDQDPSRISPFLCAIWRRTEKKEIREKNERLVPFTTDLK